MNKDNSKVMKSFSINTIAYAGMLIAISAVGAMIKISGSIAFDSMPGFFAALFLSPLLGGIVAGLGHLLTATTSGFPLSLPLHMVLIVEMFLVTYLFGLTYKKTNGVFACIIGIILNGPISLLITSKIAAIMGMPFNGWVMFNTLIVPLTLASVVNIILGYGIYSVVTGRKSK